MNNRSVFERFKTDDLKLFDSQDEPLNFYLEHPAVGYALPELKLTVAVEIAF